MKDLPKPKGLTKQVRDKAAKQERVKNKGLNMRQRERKDYIEEEYGVDVPWRHPSNDALFTGGEDGDL